MQIHLSAIQAQLGTTAAACQERRKNMQRLAQTRCCSSSCSCQPGRIRALPQQPLQLFTAGEEGRQPETGRRSQVMHSRSHNFWASKGELVLKVLRLEFHLHLVHLAFIFVLANDMDHSSYTQYAFAANFI